MAMDVVDHRIEGGEWQGPGVALDRGEAELVGSRGPGGPAGPPGGERA
jgi:hypothetical protein